MNHLPTHSNNSQAGSQMTSSVGARQVGPPPQPIGPSPAIPGLYSYQDEQRQRALLIRIARGGFVVLVVVVTLLNILKVENTSSGTREVELAIGWWIPLGAALLLSIIVLGVDLLTPNKKISTISGVFLGLLAGMLATYALSFIIDLVATTYDLHETGGNWIVATIKVLLGISLCYLGVSTVLHTQDDFRLVIPYVEFAKQIRGPKPLLLDSSALIDARIVDIAATGIVQSPLVIPHFVVAELHMLSDSSDRLRRAKGRRGLEVISKLQRSGVLDVTIDQTPVSGKAVDQMLVELARQMPGTIVTTDVALSRIAQIQGVSVLNLHDVANALKPALIPGEQISIRIIKAGEQPGQGVGYLDDGTMIVVENGAEFIGQQMPVEVTSSLQTSAGRLIFARSSVRALPQQPGATAPAPAAAPATVLPSGSAMTSAPEQPAPQEPEDPAAAESAGAPAVVAAQRDRQENGAAGAEPSSRPEPESEVVEAGPSPSATSGQPPAEVASSGSVRPKLVRTPFPPKPPSRSITGRNPRR